MKNLIIFFTITLGLNMTCLAQTQDLNHYKYVRVPAKFDFQKEENTYRLNELLAFLLEKENFEALFREPDPAGVSPCEILTAELHDESGLFKSKVYITLSDCNNNVVFTSNEGSSRKKDYRDGYRDAVRDAFESISALGHNYVESSKTTLVKTAPSEERAAKPVITSEEKEVKTFTNAGKSYRLKSTASGFELFEKEDLIATLTQSGRGDTYLYSSENINGNAFFDTSGNLVVEYLSDGNLVSLIFKRAQ